MRHQPSAFQIAGHQGQCRSFHQLLWPVWSFTQDFILSQEHIQGRRVAEPQFYGKFPVPVQRQGEFQ